MNPHQDFIDARKSYVRRAVELARSSGLRDDDIIVMLAEHVSERDTLPGPPADLDQDTPSSVSGVACTFMQLVVARTLLDQIEAAIVVPPQPGFVRVMAFLSQIVFFTHAEVGRPL